MNGRAPNCSLTGFESLPAKNLKPNACQERPEPDTSSYTIRSNTPSTAKPHAVMADLKMRSGASLADAPKRGAVRPPVSDLTFAVSTGCGPGISGRGNAALAIPITVAKSCYKSVKIAGLFHAVPASPSIHFELMMPARSGRVIDLLSLGLIPDGNRTRARQTSFPQVRTGPRPAFLRTGSGERTQFSNDYAPIADSVGTHPGAWTQSE